MNNFIRSHKPIESYGYKNYYYNNTIISRNNPTIQANYQMEGLKFNGVQQGAVINNLFIANSTTSPLIELVNGTSVNCWNNLGYSTAGTLSTPDGYNATFKWNVNPQLAAPFNSGWDPRNYMFASTSPARDAGQTTPATSDYFGTVRPQGAAFDIGAFEYPSGPPTSPLLNVSPASQNFGVLAVGGVADRSFTVQNIGAGTLIGSASVGAPFSVVSGSNYSLGPTLSQTVVVRYSPTNAGTANGTVAFSGANSGTATVSGTATNTGPANPTNLNFAASDAILTAPFVDGGGYFSQAAETTLANSGSAVFNFTLTNAGAYIIQTVVNAPGDGQNSFFVNVDAQPQDPSMIWDVPVTTGFQARTVSWRGNGTDTANQFVPQIFRLSLGAHQLIIRGREANVALQSLSIVATNAPPRPPSNLRVVSLY
jgi:hypothetical protein